LKTNLEACAALIARSARQRPHASRASGYEGVQSRFAGFMRGDAIVLALRSMCDNDLDLARHCMRDSDLDFARHCMREGKFDLAPQSVRDDDLDLAPRSVRETTALHFALREPRDPLTESNRPVSIRELVGC
jgi:hypothetical protein